MLLYVRHIIIHWLTLCLFVAVFHFKRCRSDFNMFPPKVISWIRVIVNVEKKLSLIVIVTGWESPLSVSFSSNKCSTRNSACLTSLVSFIKYYISFKIGILTKFYMQYRNIDLLYLSGDVQSSKVKICTFLGTRSLPRPLKALSLPSIAIQSSKDISVGRNISKGCIYSSCARFLLHIGAKYFI